MPKGVYERNQNRAAWNAERGLPPPRSHHARKDTPSSNNSGSSNGGMVNSSSASMLLDRPSHSTFNTLKFDYDPANPTNIRRSLNRNDVELAALSKLHKLMSVLKETIVNEFGDAAFVTAISSGGSSTAPTIPNTNMNKSNEGQSKSKFDQLVHTFTLHSTLRRKLLNRLARRLHRISHAMDTFVSSSHSAPSTPLAIHAPLPPSYGDIVRRNVSTNIEKNGIAHQLLGGTLDHVKIIRQVDVMEYNTKMNEIDTMKEVLEECTRTNNYSRVENYINGEEEKEEEGEDEENQEENNEKKENEGQQEPPPLIMSEVDSILQKEMKCQPLYNKMAEYELSNGYYDKVYHITPPPSNNNNDNDGNEKKETTVNIVKTINPLINTMDDHEVNDDGNFIINTTTTTTTSKKGGSSQII
jgi:hypothetical protein